jgi:hypothetical protein
MVERSLLIYYQLLEPRHSHQNVLVIRVKHSVPTLSIVPRQKKHTALAAPGLDGSSIHCRIELARLMAQSAGVLKVFAVQTIPPGTQVPRDESC